VARVGAACVPGRGPAQSSRAPYRPRGDGEPGEVADRRHRDLRVIRARRGGCRVGAS